MSILSNVNISIFITFMWTTFVGFIHIKHFSVHKIYQLSTKKWISICSYGSKKWRYFLLKFIQDFPPLSSQNQLSAVLTTYGREHNSVDRTL